MNFKPQPPINRQTIVITGASSGIGRATAIELARFGCKLVLAARGKDTLNEVVDVCNRLGATAIGIVTDVTNAEAMQQLAKDACTFGKSLDVWINVAGVGLLGDYTTIPMQVHDQVIKTNLLGYMHGAYAALPYFKKQRYGTIINMNSAGGFVAMPYSVAYTASKFGVKGFAEALRAELTDYKNIHICDVYPGFVDTPGPLHAGNYTGKVLKPIPPVVPTTRVAAVVSQLIQYPRATTLVGSSAYIAKLGVALAPGITKWVMLQTMKNYFKHAEPEPVTNGNLLAPTGSAYKIAGGYTSKVITKNRAELAGLIGIAAAGAFFIVKKLF